MDIVIIYVHQNTSTTEIYEETATCRKRLELVQTSTFVLDFCQYEQIVERQTCTLAITSSVSVFLLEAEMDDIAESSLGFSSLKQQASLLWIALSLIGASLVIAGFFLPANTVMIGGRSFPGAIDYDFLKLRHDLSLLALPVFSVFTPVIIAWHLRSRRAQWWSITWGAILFFQVLVNTLSLLSYFTFAGLALTQNTPIYRPAIGIFMTSVGCLMAGIAAWGVAIQRKN